ncbi:MAG: FtsX-like permease family protein [Mucilaginibacter sp.]|nr:FtsX-like permease family protein [Mucilaginibacter sp.]
MFKNYIKITWRNLIRNKLSSIINISGLAIGLACVLLIGMYVKDELSYDRFFKDTNLIYRVNTHEKMGNDEFTAGHTPPPVGLTLLTNIPEIESYTRIFKPGDEIIHFVNKGQKSSLTEKALLSVDSNFLQFFNYPLLEGNKATCLNGPNSIVLTEKAAKKYFGDVSPIGKNLVFDEYSTPFTVTAVLKDLPSQSSLQFDVLQSNVGMPPVKHFNWSWVWLQMGTYIKLKENVATDAATLQRIEAKFPAIIRQQAATAFKRIGQPFDEFIKKGGKYDLSLQPLTDVHLYSANIGNRFFPQSDIKYVYIFSAIALFIILLACVNFMNLATAQSAKRAKEIGIRKVLGSERKLLIYQFIAEAFLYTLFAAIIAVVIVSLCLPAFNLLSAKALNLAAFLNLSTWAGLLVLILLTALLAGSYPAFFLTSFKPASVLKGNGDFKASGSGFFTRNALVVFQFTVSTVLIVCTIVVYKQLLYTQSMDLGFTKENILIVADANRLDKSEESFRQELLRLPEVANASISTSLPTQNSFTDSYIPEPTADNVNAAGKDIQLSSFIVDEAFVPTLKLQMLNGRNFSKGFTDSASVILNETAVKQIGWSDPIGKIITYPGGNDAKFKVVGVVKDFNTESLHSTVMPFALFYTTSGTYHNNTSYIAVRIKPGDYNKAISSIQNKWKAFMPDNPFEYSFMDEEFDALYRTDQTIGKVFSVFTFLSITVACLGLLGLAMYTAERRTKEIGIRKVLGASVQNVVSMLSKDFLKLVIVASVIAFPIAWYAMNKWLQDFAYPTTINWWIFALAGAITLIIAFATVSFQSIKAALMNPVKSLRSE